MGLPQNKFLQLSHWEIAWSDPILVARLVSGCPAGAATAVLRAANALQPSWALW